MFTDKSVKKTKGREIPNLQDIKNKIKLGVDNYLKSTNIIFRPVFLCRKGISKTKMEKSLCRPEF